MARSPVRCWYRAGYWYRAGVSLSSEGWRALGVGLFENFTPCHSRTDTLARPAGRGLCSGGLCSRDWWGRCSLYCTAAAPSTPPGPGSSLQGTPRSATGYRSPPSAVRQSARLPGPCRRQARPPWPRGPPPNPLTFFVNPKSAIPHHRLLLTSRAARQQPDSGWRRPAPPSSPSRAPDRAGIHGPRWAGRLARSLPWVPALRCHASSCHPPRPARRVRLRRYRTLHQSRRTRSKPADFPPRHTGQKAIYRTPFTELAANLSRHSASSRS
jgi:hypothetical protein